MSSFTGDSVGGRGRGYTAFKGKAGKDGQSGKQFKTLARDEFQQAENERSVEDLSSWLNAIFSAAGEDDCKVSGESIEALFAGLSDGVVLNRLMHCIDHARLYKDDAAYDSVKKGDEGDSKAAWIHKNNVDMYNKCGLRLGLFPQDLVSHDNLIKSDQLENVKMVIANLYNVARICAIRYPHLAVPEKIRNELANEDMRRKMQYNALWNADIIAKLQKCLVRRDMMEEGDVKKEDVGRLTPTTVLALRKYINHLDPEAKLNTTNKKFEIKMAKSLQSLLKKKEFYAGEIDGDWSIEGASTLAFDHFLNSDLGFELRSPADFAGNPGFPLSQKDEGRLQKVFDSILRQWRLATSIIGSNTETKKPEWVPDKDSPNCTLCQTNFTTFTRRHHCRLCGKIYCDECSRKRYNVPRFDMKSVRVCNTCYGVLKALNVEDVRQTNELLPRYEAAAAPAKQELLSELQSSSNINVPTAAAASTGPRDSAFTKPVDTAATEDGFHHRSQTASM